VLHNHLAWSAQPTSAECETEPGRHRSAQAKETEVTQGGREQITLDGWQTDPQLRWAFQHIAEIFPTTPFQRRSGPLATLAAEPTDLSAIPVLHPFTGAHMTFDSIMASTDTDGWIVSRGGRVHGEAYPLGMPPETRHLLMSVSKSLIGVVTGILSDRGSLDPDEPVTRYVCELGRSGYAGATVRHLLDMRSGIRFSEDYLDPNAEVRLLEQAIGWAPRRHDDLPDTLYDYLLTLQQQREHGSTYEYRSCESDVLGWVCESAAGAPMADLLSELVWGPIGAQYDGDLAVDRVGTGMFDGGISATLRDLVRFGSVLLDDGASLRGAQVLSPSWVKQTLDGAPDSADVFATSADAAWMPGGMYRNQFWFPSPRRDIMVCLGIHGQMIYVNRTAGVVAAKLSSWPTPQDVDKLFSTLAAFDAASFHLA
jgi:CubicO group peptidase (beta-lactamase class C family)